MAGNVKNPTQQLVAKLREDLTRVLEDARQLELNPRSRSVLSGELQRSAAALNGLLAEIDPIVRPSVVFDPGNPRTVGFFVALAMTAQPRKPLAELSAFYGAGIYALYYSGPFKSYQPISSTESPIYVGMALQGAYGAHDPISQGTPLASRLNEHRKNISRASETLDLAHFSYRALVVQSGWEGPAEDHLIRLFRPVWNRESKILYGFGKHGDSAETRKNSRSPWDTLHAGRKWAAGDHQQGKKSVDEIEFAVATHFDRVEIYQTLGDVIKTFVDQLQQSG